MVLVGLGLIVVVLRLAKRGNLSFRYTIGWVWLLLLGTFSSFFAWVAEPLSSLFGVTPGVIVTSLGVLVLVMICIQLSVSISGLQDQARRLAQELALSQFVLPCGEQGRRSLVIIPALNEERTVGAVVSDVLSRGYSVLVIDDGSSDRTRASAISAGAFVVSMPFNTGVGGALRAGLRFAVTNGYETVIQCDADGQHPASHIQQLVDLLDTGACDMAIGSRFVGGQAERMRVPAVRRFVMRVLAASASRAVGERITDVTSGFRAWRGPIVPALAEHMPSYYLGDTYEAVIAAGRAGYRVKEIPSPIGERLHGTSSASPLQAARLTARAFATAVLHLHVRLPPRR